MLNVGREVPVTAGHLNLEFHPECRLYGGLAPGFKCKLCA